MKRPTGWLALALLTSVNPAPTAARTDEVLSKVVAGESDRMALRFVKPAD